MHAEPDERLAQTPLQDDVAIRGIGTLDARHADRDLRAVEDTVPEAHEPCEGSVLDDGLRKPRGHAGIRVTGASRSAGGFPGTPLTPQSR